jgi:hypothetical protein
MSVSSQPVSMQELTIIEFHVSPSTVQSNQGTITLQHSARHHSRNVLLQDPRVDTIHESNGFSAKAAVLLVVVNGVN